MMAQVYNPITQEAEIGKTVVQGQPRHKVSETPSQPTSQSWWYASVIPATQEA
jgi:hypothetical protein